MGPALSRVLLAASCVSINARQRGEMSVMIDSYCTHTLSSFSINFTTCEMSVEQSTAKAGRKQSASPSPQPTVSYQQQQDRISNTVYDITTEDEVVGNCTAQYYTTVDTESTENSPHTYNRVSVDPETPLSSSKGSTSSEGTELSTDNQRNLCVPAANSSQSDVNVKHWTHEEQFKQVCNLFFLLLYQILDLQLEYNEGMGD